jgi:hypothetical protein
MAEAVSVNFVGFFADEPRLAAKRPYTCDFLDMSGPHWGRWVNNR